MKDKRVDLRSTLNKKVALNNSAKNIESINQKVSEIHQKGHNEIIRTTIHLPIDIHTKIKMYCVANGMSFKEYVTETLAYTLNKLTT